MSDQRLAGSVIEPESEELRKRRPSPVLGPVKIPEGGFMRNFYFAAVKLRAAAFRGVRANAPVPDNLFPLKPTNISTAPVLAAAQKLRASMSDEQQAACTYGIETDHWRSWCNFHIPLFRHGISLTKLSEQQRELVFEMMRASLSERGFRTARDVIRLNHHMAEISGRTDEFGELYFWVSFMGVPSATEPWGWQIDGQHLAINCFVLGDQIIVSPTFMGSEPVYAKSGKYKGTRVFQDEVELGLKLVRSLSSSQQRKAVLGKELPYDVFAHSFNDNLELPYQGIASSELDETQRQKLTDILAFYIGRERPGHAELRLKEVLARLDETSFVWIGEWGETSPFYYRVHNPLILIEFDHQPGVMYANEEHSRRHAHTVVRTPNGNDYGKALLRQYYEQVRRSPLHDPAQAVEVLDTIREFGNPTLT